MTEGRKPELPREFRVSLANWRAEVDDIGGIVGDFEALLCIAEALADHFSVDEQPALVGKPELREAARRMVEVLGILSLAGRFSFSPEDADHYEAAIGALRSALMGPEGQEGGRADSQKGRVEGSNPTQSKVPAMATEPDAGFSPAPVGEPEGPQPDTDDYFTLLSDWLGDVEVLTIQRERRYWGGPSEDPVFETTVTISAGSEQCSGVSDSTYSAFVAACKRALAGNLGARESSTGDPRAPSEAAIEAAQREYFAEAPSLRGTAAYACMAGALKAAYAVDFGVSPERSPT